MSFDARTMSAPMTFSPSDRLSPSAAHPQPKSETRRFSKVDRDSNWASDLLLADLSPDAILEALSTGDKPVADSRFHSQLRNSIENASPVEKDLATRAAIVAKSLKHWVLELENWDWPGSSGFEPPRQAQLSYKNDLGHDSVSQGYSDLQGGRRGSDGFIGAFPASIIIEHEDRIRSIRKDIEELGVENLKEHALDAHVSSRSRPSSSYSQETSVSTLSSYTRLEDITALITATTLQALPYLARLNRLLNTWTIRLLVLRKVPTFLSNLQKIEGALRSSWAVAEPRGPEPHASLSAVEHAHGSSSITREKFIATRNTVQEQVVRLGEELDGMLDALEGHEDTVPDIWIDQMEAIEAEYKNWVSEAEKAVSRDDWRYSRHHKAPSVDHLPLVDGAVDDWGDLMALQHRKSDVLPSEEPGNDDRQPRSSHLENNKIGAFDIISDNRVQEPEWNYYEKSRSEATDNTLSAFPDAPSAVRAGRPLVPLSESIKTPAEASIQTEQEPRIDLAKFRTSDSPSTVQNFSVQQQAQFIQDGARFDLDPTHGSHEMEIDSLLEPRAEANIIAEADISSHTLNRQLELLSIGQGGETISSDDHVSNSLAGASNKRTDVSLSDAPPVAAARKLGSPWVSPVRHRHSSEASSGLNMKNVPPHSPTRHGPPDGPRSQPQVRHTAEMNIRGVDDLMAGELNKSSGDVTGVWTTSPHGPEAVEAEHSSFSDVRHRNTNSPLVATRTPDIVLDNADSPPQSTTLGADYFSRKGGSHLSPESAIPEDPRFFTKYHENRPTSSGEPQASKLPKLQSGASGADQDIRGIVNSAVYSNDSFVSDSVDGKSRAISNAQSWNKDNLTFNFNSLPPSRKVSFEGKIPRSSSSRKPRLSEAGFKPSAIPRPSFGSADSSPSLRHSREGPGMALLRLKPFVGPQAIVPAKHKSIEDLRQASAKRLRRQPSATESLSDVASRDIQIKPVQNVDENLDRKIKSILHSLNGPIKMTAEGHSNSHDAIVSKTKSLPRALRPQRSFSSNPGFPFSRGLSSDTLARSPGDNEIRLYHLQRADREAPIKLYVRPVGDHSERVMVRVGGGWADLTEYLREYASHHGRRSASEGKFENHKLARNSPLASSMTSDGHLSPVGRPQIISERPRSSLGVKKTRPRLSGAGPARSHNMPPSTPPALTPGGIEDTPPSAYSFLSQSSHTEDDIALGLAGPRSRKHEMSAEKQAWIDRMMEQAKASESDKKKKKKKKSDWGELGRIGGTRRIFLRDKNADS
ncbi:hypothetical protein L228DRAFT_30066 [Xylona heveae TC161]|uniref:GAR domain-containing protein n=1 Tax=Xylona heveae (strain CBS 132557 / TC161) TaxID=1328760 RepID=A0A165A1J9_XYLHT|nr:hypothetical protein L228DRAFT_30066 [Xylona heveae TC161]KZF19826.1 hypothetical protein L228DRAFT_30066 [Xylona heveae TC161]